MTDAQHHATINTGVLQPAGADLKGAAPQGMWWVAWHQHRLQIATALALMAALAAAMVVLRIHVASTLRAVGCSATDMDSCTSLGAPTWAAFSSLENQWRLLHGVLIAVPIVLGVFLGAPLFSRELSNGTHVLALTQSVRRRRWWVTKLTVVVAPLLGGLIGLGYLTQWVDHGSWLTDRGALADGTFQVQSVMPAVWGLLAVSIATTAGLVLRSVIGSLAAALLVAAGLVLLLAFPLRTHVVPSARQITPIADMQYAAGPGSVIYAATGAYAPGALFLDSGFITADGTETGFQMACEMPQARPDAMSDDDWAAQQNEALQKCWRDQGIVGRYVHYLPAGMLWPLRWVMTGICAVLAALFLGAGAWRLKPAIAKR